VAEAFFDTILVNGAVYPEVNVPAQRVRFRILNGSQGRMLHLNLYQEEGESGEPIGITGNASGTGNPALYSGQVPGPTIYQIGNEGGFLPAVAVHPNNIPITLDLTNDPTGQTAIPDGPFNLMLAPAERADIVIDFAGLEGQSFILYNDAPAPFPGGDSRNDYFTGNADQTGIGGAPPTMLGMGPNTRTLMRFVVGAAVNGGDGGEAIAAWLRTINSALRQNFAAGGQQDPPLYTGVPPFGAFTPFTGTPDRVLTLNEDFDEFGRLIQTLGTNVISGNNNQGIATFGRGYEGPGGPPGNLMGENQGTVSGPSVPSGITENPTAGATEVWVIFNTTADTHPMHFHLVNLQVIQRQAYDTTQLPPTGAAGESVDLMALLTGSAMPPDPNEAGWKEVVRMNPGEATWFIAQWKLPTLPAVIASGDNANSSPRTGGHEYVWHCHILEHEEHDMMRAITVRGTFPTS